jgi:tRNA (guanine-N7-)-methyltransferase
MHIDPYVNCPRLPSAGAIDPRQLFLDAAGEALVPDEGGRSSPVELEIGPGRGWFTLERLAADPTARVVGLEIRRKWATIVDERLKKRHLADRGRVFAEDAALALPRFVSRSLSIAYLHFPDPWWKKRHEKRLVLSDPLLTELGRVLVVGGELLIQTDVFERADEYEAKVAASPFFQPWESTARVQDHPHQARSPRERKAMEDGLPVARLRYRNLGVAAPTDPG